MRREAPRVGLLMGAEQLPERQRVRVAKMGVPGGNSDWVKKVQDADGVFGGVAECPAAKASRCAFARSASGPEGAISKYCL